MFTIIFVEQRKSPENRIINVPPTREESRMVNLFLGLIIVFVGYTAAIVIGGAIASLIGVPVTFLSIWGIMLIMVISAFIASSRSLSKLKKGKTEDD